MVVYLKDQGKTVRPPRASPRKPKQDQQGAIKLFGRRGINLADDLPDPVTPQRDHLVRHDL
jgi:hypothetical protein